MQFIIEGNLVILLFLEITIMFYISNLKCLDVKSLLLKN